MIIRRVSILLLALCSTAAAVTNGWQLSVDTNGVLQAPPRVTGFTFTNAVALAGTVTGGPGFSNAVASASGWDAAGNMTTWNGDQNLDITATTWGTGESFAMTWAGSLHLIGGAVNGTTNGGQLFVGGVGQLISDDSAGILRLSPGWTNAIQAASPPAVVSAVSYATNAGTASRASNLVAPYVVSVNGSTGAVTIATAPTPVYALAYHFTNGMVVTNANSWVRWPHLTNTTVVSGITLNSTGGVTVTSGGVYHVSATVSGQWGASLFSWALATNGLPVEFSKVGRLLGSAATVTLQPDALLSLSAGSTIDLVLRNVNPSTAITNDVSRLQIYRVAE
jgi:hypothetical protein